jgi:hypothetical protein
VYSEKYFDAIEHYSSSYAYAFHYGTIGSVIAAANKLTKQNVRSCDLLYNIDKKRIIDPDNLEDDDLDSVCLFIYCAEKYPWLCWYHKNNIIISGEMKEDEIVIRY